MILQYCKLPDNLLKLLSKKGIKTAPNYILQNSAKRYAYLCNLQGAETVKGVNWLKIHGYVPRLL